MPARRDATDRHKLSVAHAAPRLRRATARYRRPKTSPCHRRGCLRHRRDCWAFSPARGLAVGPSPGISLTIGLARSINFPMLLLETRLNLGNASGVCPASGGPASGVFSAISRMSANSFAISDELASDCHDQDFRRAKL